MATFYAGHLSSSNVVQQRCWFRC